MDPFLYLSFFWMYTTTISQSPPELIDIIIHKMWSSNAPNCTMYKYNYGGAIIFDSMYTATNQFSNQHINANTTKQLDYNALLSPLLNYYLYNDTSTSAYMIQSGETIPWSSSLENAIGDEVGLFPIVYLDALLYQYIKNNDITVFDFNRKYATEWQLIFTTADYYILKFPRRLSDKYGTISRDDH
eukprot:16857_1